MPMVPTVVERTDRYERTYDIFSRLLEDRVIMLQEPVTDALAATITAQLLFLEAQDPDKDVTVYINSPGGSVSAGLAIYDTMRYIRCDVTTVCMGMAASMGAFLLAGGTKGKRFCLPNAEVMIHQPLGGAQGQATDIIIAAEHIGRTKRRLTDILAENTGRDVVEISKACDRDNWLTADEALEFGLVDKIIDKR